MLQRLLLASSTLLSPGCSRSAADIEGELLGTSFDLGHQIRDRESPGSPIARQEKVKVVVIGGGMAGLSAAWRLQQAGLDDFAVLELEPQPGGTSRFGESRVTAYPWGAHYVPVPPQQYSALWKLFADMELLTQDAGVHRVREDVLCREPEERIHAGGRWSEGLYPRSIATEVDLLQWNAFQAAVAHWIDWRDAAGNEAFTIPIARCSPDPALQQLDQISMADWMRAQGWNSQPLFWLVDHCCRDDYGLTVEQTSAWAGLFYFCARRQQSTAPAPQLLTWPEGNGRIVRYLAELAGQRQRLQHAALSVVPAKHHVSVTALDIADDTLYRLDAESVIFAAPQFLVPYLISELPDLRVAAARQFSYGAWVVANLHLSDRPATLGFQLAWDNIIHESPSLGYVVATHQSGSDYGPTVLTWYMPMCDDLPAEDRRQLLNLSWQHWAEFILTDLERAHPDIRDLVSRLDVMRWGHAMIQPRPGFMTGAERSLARQPVQAIHFAGTDLSGLPLMEEAFYHGVRAAEEVLQSRGVPHSSLL
jgi:monoamine oxidase